MRIANRPAHGAPETTAEGMRSLWGVAWRNLTAHPLRSTLTALAVSLGVAMTLAADFVSAALLETLVSAGEGDLQVTHGFVVEQFDMLLGQVAFVLTGVAAFLVFNTFAMAVSQRQRQLGLLRALGTSRSQLVRLVLVEALLVGGGGTLVGLALGPLLGRGIVTALKAVGGDVLAFGAGSVSAGSVLLAVALGVGMTAASTLIPARRAAGVAPLAAMRPKMAAAPARTARGAPLAGSAAILVLFGGLAAAPPGEWAPAPWNSVLAAVLVAVWLGALGLLLPAGLQLAGRWARRLGPRSAGGRLVGDNIRRNRGRVMLTALTLAVGPAAITGLAGFMTFAFNDLLGDSMDRLAAEGAVSVFPFDLEQGLAGLAELDELLLPPTAIAAVADTVGDEGTIAAYRFALIPELSFLGDSYFTYVVDPETVRDNRSAFRFTEGERTSAVAMMEAGCAALVTPVVAQRNGAGIGDTIMISGVRGRLPCKVAGIGTGYANASLVSSRVADAVGATPPVGLTIVPIPGSDVDRLEAAVRATAADEGVWVTRMSDFADLQRELVELVAVALNGMLLLAIVGAALGVVNTTMISLAEREQELALLRAVGATRRQVRRVVLGENALLGAVAGIFGVAAGLGSVVIIVTTFGGRSWGVTDLALWPAAARALRPALLNGLVALAATPLLSALAARPLLRPLLSGPISPGKRLS